MGLLRASYWLTVLFAIWVVLSTVIPNIIGNDASSALTLVNVDGYMNTALYNSINSKGIVDNELTNSHILLLTAHPDDESMFFTPIITELKKRNYNNKIHLVCMSDGGYDGLGQVRKQELGQAARILNIDTWKVLNYVDDIKTFWDATDLSRSIDKEVKQIKNEYSVKTRNIVILTFDEGGVSGHPNHRSLYHAAKLYSSKKHIRCYTLKTWNIFTKYSSVLVTIVELAFRWILKWEDSINQTNFLGKELRDYLPAQFLSNSITVYSDLNSLFLNLSTMTWAHYSQIVWFRWIWIFMSKYMNSNELVALT